MRVLLCFQQTRNVRFNWNTHNFKFNYLSRGQLVSLNLDKIFLTLLKILPCYEAFFGNLIFAIIARMLCGNHLNLPVLRSKDAGIWPVLYLTVVFLTCTVEPLYSQDTTKASVIENIQSLFFADSSRPCFRSIEQGRYHNGIVNAQFCL